jgi:hypothetical protein
MSNRLIDYREALALVDDNRAAELDWEMRGHLLANGLAEIVFVSSALPAWLRLRVFFRVTPAVRLFIEAMGRPIPSGND